MRRLSIRLSSKWQHLSAECARLPGDAQGEQGMRNAESSSHPAPSQGSSCPGWGLGTSASSTRTVWRSRAIGWGVALVLLAPWSASADTTEREPITMKVVAVNPSSEKVQTVPVKIELPQEVTPKDVLEKGELDLEFDEERSIYYVHKEAVQLQPKETRVFEVKVRDVWFVPEPELTSLKDYTNLLLGRLEKSDYAATAKQISSSILDRLQSIHTTQNDETLGRKTRIGAYRYHLQTIEQIKEDLARMEKLLTFVGGPPVPEMLEESPLKSDAPSRTTTWLVIFLIVIFLGLLGGQFFFTWHSKTQGAHDLSIVRQTAFGHASPVAPRNGAAVEAGKPREATAPLDRNRPSSPRLN